MQNFVSFWILETICQFVPKSKWDLSILHFLNFCQSIPEIEFKLEQIGRPNAGYRYHKPNDKKNNWKWTSFVCLTNSGFKELEKTKTKNKNMMCFLKKYEMRILWGNFQKTVCSATWGTHFLKAFTTFVNQTSALTKHILSPKEFESLPCGPAMFLQPNQTLALERAFGGKPSLLHKPPNIQL